MKPIADIEGYVISTDARLLDIDVINKFLSEDSYWSKGIPRQVVELAIANSLCFGVYHQGPQVGFARIVTDRATFALVADVFVLSAHRGIGLSKWLMQTVAAHKDLQGLRRFGVRTGQ